MSHAELHFRTKTASPKRSVAASPSSSTHVLNCLIVAQSPARRELLLSAVSQGGWDSIVCSDTESALLACQRTGFRLAVVDVSAGSKRSAKLQDLCQAITSNKHALLIVCGRESNAREEIWARQLGAWLYLPGAIGVDDFARLCDEAPTGRG